MAAGGLVCIPRNFATATPQTGRRSRGVPLSLMGALAPVAPHWLRPWVDIFALCIMCWTVVLSCRTLDVCASGRRLLRTSLLVVWQCWGTSGGISCGLWWTRTLHSQPAHSALNLVTTGGQGTSFAARRCNCMAERVRRCTTLFELIFSLGWSASFSVFWNRWRQNM